MKLKYIVLLSLSAGAALLSGCSEFLKLTPDSEYSVAGAYKTENDFIQAIVGVYAQQQNLYASNSTWFRALSGRSDETRNNITYLEGMSSFTNNSTNPVLLDAWNNFYRTIALCNEVIGRIGNGSFTNETSRSNIKGEAYALRAWAYWNLAWQFGGVPLIDRTLTVEETKTIKRSTQEESFAFAERDLKEAINLLPEKWTGANAGRVTKYAAQSLLARLYLFQKNFTSAKSTLEGVIQSGLYAMEGDYRNCFTDSKDNGPERVWEIQFTGGQKGEGQAFSTGLLPEGFNDKSIMPFSGFSTAMEVSQPMYDSYEPGDKRRNLSILKGWKNAQGQSDTVSKFIIKYLHYEAYTPQAQNDWAINLPVIRYTDVLMMYAEVLNEIAYEGNGEALKILNQVRSRAGLAALTAADLPNKDSFRNAIIKERRVEFAFEGLRWTDLIRWGLAKETMNAFFKRSDEGNGLYSMSDYQVLFPIPFEELSRYNDTSVLWQNDGY